MTHRLRDWLLLYVLAVLINGVVAILVSSPGYMDAYYYFNGARLIMDGQSLVEPYLWNYVSAPPALPAPAFVYWQPLSSFLAAIGIWLFGKAAAFGSVQAIYVLVIAIFPVVGYEVALQVGERRHALLVGLLIVFSGYYVVRWSLPETFTPFALAGTGALALASLGLQERRWWVWMLSGVCAGLANLTRADGILILLVIVFVCLLSPFWSRLLTGKEGGDSTVRIASFPLQVGIIMLGYLLVMAPWFWRNLTVFGGIQAPGGLDALWLNDYNDLSTYPTNLSPEHFLSAGWGVILSVKWNAFLINVATFIGVQNLVFLTPFTLVGMWRRWRDPWLLPAFLYGLALFAVMTLAFSLVGARGGYFHSGGALLPFVFTAAALGLDDVLRWMARRRRWRFEQARQVFSVFIVGLAVMVTGYVVMIQVVGWPLSGKVAWNSSDAVYGDIGATLDELQVPPSVNVMSNDPPGFYYHTGRGGVPLPNGDENMLVSAARDYQIGFLVVDQRVVAGLESLYLDGPTTGHLVLVKEYGSEDQPVYLYRVIP